MIKSYLNKLIEISKKNHSYWLLAETYFLQAKIELATLDLEEAERSLARSHQTAEEYGLNLLITRILNQRDELERQIDKWEEIKKKRSYLSESIALARVEEQLILMLRKKLSLEKYSF
jgi:molecular chaperone GrpE (heat shock protein)